MTQHDPMVRVHHMLDHAREAAARVPDDFRRGHRDVPWQDVADLRNRLIHGYDVVDFDILWEIIRRDLPPLIAALERIAGGEQ